MAKIGVASLFFILSFCTSWTDCRALARLTSNHNLQCLAGERRKKSQLFEWCTISKWNIKIWRRPSTYFYLKLQWLKFIWLKWDLNSLGSGPEMSMNRITNEICAKLGLFVICEKQFVPVWNELPVNQMNCLRVCGGLYMWISEAQEYRKIMQ